ncbi:hypothetical protein M514_11487 [Trichuris suis]|uniref:Uncharacterized protein n=1 Tax=Trichuris suis TaxID=68888 RepID=A0A085NS76_9BILA|nr:hypothetical protein M513_11487 [Trichuris suis]KFD72322.1 hypothetical protein M514_11487 [Trichuris suis]
MPLQFQVEWDDRLRLGYKWSRKSKVNILTTLPTAWEHSVRPIERMTRTIVTGISATNGSAAVGSFKGRIFCITLTLLVQRRTGRLQSAARSLKSCKHPASAPALTRVLFARRPARFVSTTNGPLRQPATNHRMRAQLCSIAKALGSARPLSETQKNSIHAGKAFEDGNTNEVNGPAAAKAFRMSHVSTKSGTY